MKKNNIFAIVCVMLTVLLTSFGMMSCSDSEENKGNSEFKPISLAPERKKIVDNARDFAFAVYGEQEDVLSDESNFIFSPFNLTSYLSLVANCTDENMANKIIDAMMPGGTVSDLTALNEHYANLTADLISADNKVSFKTGSSVWMLDKFTVNSTLNEILIRYYSANCNLVEKFDNSGANIISKWVKDFTDGRAENAVHETSISNLDAVIINAVTFTAKWQLDSFDTADTKKESFHNLDGTTSQVDMMTGKSSAARLYFNDEIGMAELGFGNGAYTISFFMPLNPSDFKKMEFSWLSPKYIAGLKENGRTVRTKTFKMPRLNIDDRFQMNDALYRLMGISDIYLSSLTGSSNSQLGEIHQQIAFNLDEEGVKADAVTNNMLTIIPNQEKGEFIIDNPFVFMITESSTGSVIFMGRVVKM